MTTEYEYAKDLAIHFWEENYKHIAPDWEPCEDLMGVLTQIDNMMVGYKPLFNIKTIYELRKIELAMQALSLRIAKVKELVDKSKG